jgi:hypothetical protein
MAEKKVFRQVGDSGAARGCHPDADANPAGTGDGQRFAHELHAADAAVARDQGGCARRPGSVSRNTWIVEAVAEQLAFGGKVGL